MAEALLDPVPRHSPHPGNDPDESKDADVRDHGDYEQAAEGVADSGEAVGDELGCDDAASARVPRNVAAPSARTVSEKIPGKKFAFIHTSSNRQGAYTDTVAEPRSRTLGTILAAAIVYRLRRLGHLRVIEPLP